MVEKNIMKPRSGQPRREEREFDERVIEVQRVSRVVKGGRRIRFRALVAIGDRKGKVGMGVAKASEVAEAVRKAVNQAKKNMVSIPVINGTIPHEVIAKYGSAKVMLKPATPGTTIVAGGSVRVVVELAGITDILSKIMGSSNKINNVSATLKALSSFNPEIVAKINKMFNHPEIAKQTKAEALTKVLEKGEEPSEEKETEKKPSKTKTAKAE